MPDCQLQDSFVTVYMIRIDAVPWTFESQCETLNVSDKKTVEE